VLVRRLAASSILFACTLSLAACASLTKPPAAALPCGDPCAAAACPSAFVCEVDARCAARCLPEGVPKH
jgi:hypothetical protein